jgi:hypothetical protein
MMEVWACSVLRVMFDMFLQAFNLDLTAGAGMVANNMVRNRRK